jgi:hypothetical protein
MNTPLTEKELREIKILCETRFDGGFRSTPNLQAVIRKPCEHIGHQEAMLEMLKTYIWLKETGDGKAEDKQFKRQRPHQLAAV